MQRPAIHFALLFLGLIVDPNVASAQMDFRGIIHEFVGRPRPSQTISGNSAPISPVNLSEKPTFSCKVMRNSVARILCSGREGATADWSLNSVLWAMAGSNNESQQRTLDQDQQHWRDSLNKQCSLPPDSAMFSQVHKACVLRAFQDRTGKLRSKLSGDALAESQLTPEQRADIQRLLIARGILQADADGEFGSITRQAIRIFQETAGLSPTGFLSSDQISSLRASQRSTRPSTPQNMTNAPVTQSETDQLRTRLTTLWGVRANPDRPEELVVDVQLKLGTDGRLSSPPEIVSRGSSARYQAAAEAAVRAVIQAQPFDMLRPESYDNWKDMIVTFDPRTVTSSAKSEVSNKAEADHKLSETHLSSLEDLINAQTKNPTAHASPSSPELAKGDVAKSNAESEKIDVLGISTGMPTTDRPPLSGPIGMLV